MSNTASDTLSIARRLKAAGVEPGEAYAIVDAMDKFTGQFVTVQHFDAAVARLDARIDGVEVRIDGLKDHIDAVRTELQASIDTTRSNLQAGISAGQATMTRFLVIVAGVIIAANALMIGILRFFPRDGAVM